MDALIGTVAGVVILLGAAGLKIDREYERGVVFPSKAITKVENYQLAVYQAALTTLRNVVGQNILDDVLQNRDKINHKVQEIVDEMTEPWGIVIERVEMKDVEIPTSMQRAMAKEAEAIREKRARLIKAAAEQEASIKLAEASQKIVENPAALELRRLQMLTEIGAENNTTTLIMMPSDFITLAKQWTDVLAAGNKGQAQPVPPNGQVNVEPVGDGVPSDRSSNARLGASTAAPFATSINPTAEPLPQATNDWKTSDPEDR